MILPRSNALARYEWLRLIPDIDFATQRYPIVTKGQEFMILGRIGRDYFASIFAKKNGRLAA
jgi:hypothetical protein